jgi:L-lactate dehydrogenase complex protein LldG
MIDNSAARQAILSRIRGSRIRDSGIRDAKTRGIPDDAGSESTARDYAEIPRAYQRTGSLNAAQQLDLFEERLVEYDAHVHRVSESALPAAISTAIERRGARRIAVPVGIPAAWVTSSISVTEAESLSSIELDKFDGVLSGCTVAIALTGTIVLQNAPSQGPRKLSLVPDFHLCVVYANQIVETVSEAFDRLAATATLPTTFISGPSATADIEMTRIKGVHGPRFLEVLIVC